MKLILEAIKSLFRGVNAHIQQTATALSKRIDKVQNAADVAKKNAATAQTTAENAQTTAENAGAWKLVKTLGMPLSGTVEVTVPKFNELLIVGWLKNEVNIGTAVQISLNGFNLAQPEVMGGNHDGFRVQAKVYHDSQICCSLFAGGATISGSYYRIEQANVMAINHSFVQDSNTLRFDLPDGVSLAIRQTSIYYR